MIKSVNLDEEVFAKGLRNARKRGFRHSFSAYVNWLIERDNPDAETIITAPQPLSIVDRPAPVPVSYRDDLDAKKVAEHPVRLRDDPPPDPLPPASAKNETEAGPAP